MWWRTPWLGERRLLLALALLDAGLLAGAYNLLFRSRFQVWAGLTPSVLALIVLWLGSSYLLGRYSTPDQGQRDSELRRLATTAIVALLVLAGVVVVLSWGLKVDDPRTFRSFVLPLLAAVSSASALAQLALMRRRRRRRRRRWLLVGEAAELAVLRRERRHDGRSPHLDLTYCESGTVCESGALGEGSPADPVAADLAAGQPFDGIAVSEAARLDDALMQALLARRGAGTSVCSLVVWAEQHLQRVPPELFSSRWLVQAEGFELQPGRWGWRLKRLGDVLVAALLLTAAAPLLLLAAVLIRLEDGGPVLYRQRRTGLYGELFEVCKLRSMRQEAERDGPRWASRADPRITRIGAWLRRLRIDELPQLISVLNGEMSLIGPRPERPELEEILERSIPHYRVRHWVRPGLSGWAQVCYPYGASVEDSRMKLSYDLYYLRNANLMLDLLILLKTIRLVARAQGAVPSAAGRS